MKKKVLALLLTTTMIAGLTAGCGGNSDSGSGSNTTGDTPAAADTSTSNDNASASSDDPWANVDTSEHVVITYMTTGETPTGTKEKYDQMMTELNKILTEKCNAELQTYFISWTDYLSNYNLTLAQMDGTVDLVGTASDWLDAWPNSKNGAFLELSEDMLKTYAPKTWASVPAENWELCKYNGDIYLIPEDNYAQWTNHGFIYRLDWAKAAGLSDGVKSWEDLTTYFKYVKETYPDIIPWDSDGTQYAQLAGGWNMMLERGVTVPLITSDGPFEEALSCGGLDGIHPTGNFGSRTKERFAVLSLYAKGGPLMCAEFWVGWFDHWGNGGHMRGNPESPQDLDDMLDMGHVNIYMFEGGTNFGFMNGSNYYDELTPDVTSYDYDALLTEAGDFTEKYYKFQKVIGKYAPVPKVEFTTRIQKKAYGKLTAVSQTGLMQNLANIAQPVVDKFPVCMEKCGQGYGYILYHSVLRHEQNLERIRLWGANDRANIFVDNRRVVNLYDRELEGEYDVPAGKVKKAQDANAPSAGEESGTKNEPITFAPDAPIDILMENMGRVNFGPLMERQRKGIQDCVQINGHMHYNWTMYPLPLDNIDRLDFDRDFTEGLPAFYKFELDVDEAGDTFLELDGWGKGCVFLNGFNLGRYWEIGPQRRLYIPAPLLRHGKNELIVFETEGKATGTIELKDEPDIG